MSQPFNIEKMFTQSGRVAKEDNAYINWADYLQRSIVYGTGLTYALSYGDAGVVSVEIDAEPDETVALNVYLDRPSIISQVDVVGDYPVVVRDGLATGDYGEIVASAGLNRLLSFDDGSQGQAVRSAVAIGEVLADGIVDDSILTNATKPITVLATNNTSETKILPVYVTFYRISTTPSLTLLQSDTLLLSDTEMGDYGAS